MLLEAVAVTPCSDVNRLMAAALLAAESKADAPIVTPLMATPSVTARTSVVTTPDSTLRPSLDVWLKPKATTSVNSPAALAP
jgi:hypothetical protein